MDHEFTEAVRQYPTLQPIMAKLFDERNDAMTGKIEEFLKGPKTYFVAIGAGHLVGARGILSQIKGKNYRVEQL